MTPARSDMPIEMVSFRVREHPPKERMPFGVVPWTEQRDVICIVRRNERMKELSKEAEGRPKIAVELKQR